MSLLVALSKTRRPASFIGSEWRRSVGSTLLYASNAQESDGTRVYAIDRKSRTLYATTMDDAAMQSHLDDDIALNAPPPLLKFVEKMAQALQQCGPGTATAAEGPLVLALPFFFGDEGFEVEVEMARVAEFQEGDLAYELLISSIAPGLLPVPTKRKRRHNESASA